MNWRLTRDADTAKIDDWSEWKFFDEIRPRKYLLDTIYDDLESQGKADGVVKLGPGAYLASGGSWLY